MKRLKTLCYILFLSILSGCTSISQIQNEFESSLNDVESGVEAVTGLDVDSEAKVGVELGLLAVSLNHRGEIEVAVIAETPAIPTPLGGLSAFVEAEMGLEDHQALTIASKAGAWNYDLQGQPFAIDLVNVDASVRGDGQGNIVIFIDDSRVQGDVAPIFKQETAPGLAVYTGEILISTVVIGESANGLPIEVTKLGNGRRAVVLVGGFHAGFAPATVELAENMVAYFQDHPEEVPQDVSIYIIPVANPDSLTGGIEEISGRINGNGVDINRNWDCNFSQTAVWRSAAIDAGPYPFSEPENIALRDFFLELAPVAVIFWEARGELVLPGRCNQTYHSDSQRLASVYGANSGYEFGFITGYQVMGDVSDWLDSKGISSISILLSSYTSTDWQRNLNGVKDVLQDVARQ